MSPDAQVIHVYKQPQEIVDEKNKQVVRISDSSPKESMGIGGYLGNKLKAFGKKWGKRLLIAGGVAATAVAAHYIGKHYSEGYRKWSEANLEPVVKWIKENPIMAYCLAKDLGGMSPLKRWLVAGGAGLHSLLKANSETYATVAPYIEKFAMFMYQNWKIFKWAFKLVKSGHPILAGISVAFIALHCIAVKFIPKYADAMDELKKKVKDWACDPRKIAKLLAKVKELASTGVDFVKNVIDTIKSKWAQFKNYARGATDDEKAQRRSVNDVMMQPMGDKEEFVPLGRYLAQMPHVLNWIKYRHPYWKILYLPKGGHFQSDNVMWRMYDRNARKVLGTADLPTSPTEYPTEFIEMLRKKQYIWGKYSAQENPIDNWDYKIVHDEKEKYIDPGTKAILRQKWACWKIVLNRKDIMLECYTYPQQQRVKALDIYLESTGNGHPLRFLTSIAHMLKDKKTPNSMFRFYNADWMHRPEQFIHANQFYSLKKTDLIGVPARVKWDRGNEVLHLYNNEYRSIIPYAELDTHHYDWFNQREIILI